MFGLEYQMKFDTELQQGDEVYEDKGVKVVVDPIKEPPLPVRKRIRLYRRS
jgi:Fe-S cluster assembly iron-binding protein IscA